MKSKTDELTEKAFYHAMNFFKHNDRGVDNQRVCIQQLMGITGFDFDTCLKIQNPVLSLYMADYTMSIGQSVIESNIQMVTQTIRNHLLDVQINYSQKTFDQKSSNSILSCKDIIEKTTNAPHGNLLSGVRIIDISKSNTRNEDIGVLVQHLQYQGLNLNKFDASNNLLGYGAVENLFYTFSLSRSNTALYNIKYMNLSNNYIGDDGAKYISSHLSAGLHPNLRYLDVSGNPITEKSYVHFAESFKSEVVKEMVVILKIANTLPEIKAFFSKGFKYYINEIDKYVSNFPTDKIRSNVNADKWKECKELGGKVGKSMLHGFVKGVLSGKKEAIAVYMAEEAVVDNLLTPEAFYCYIDTKKLVGEVFDESCTIF